MTPRHLVALALAVLALAALVLPGCEHQVTDYPPQQPLTTKGANYKQVLVHFHDVPDVETLQFYCNRSGAESLKYGCALAYGANNPDYPDRAFVEVWMIAPRDFNDVPALAILGHEVLHGRGWRHGP